MPGGGLAGAAEDLALLSYAGLKRETPDRPEPGVPQVLSRERPSGFDRGFDWPGAGETNQRVVGLTRHG